MFTTRVQELDFGLLHLQMMTRKFNFRANGTRGHLKVRTRAGQIRGRDAGIGICELEQALKGLGEQTEGHQNDLCHVSRTCDGRARGRAIPSV